ncbi:putative dipeptidyl aminopeptidase/acylaminoacyl-peptidase [Phenylobacterium zucineum HLK1]|uniref:Putative dipeptidyl aminopeptidase/acylaminoacyl-peptidase n=1 Tax=Phenylobacterium zucineum (strain HLK1) TaxID=450851 RepID=B4RFZ3_PHEZH|nr:putative dipeptidyl aminopeptidase/acylaminoacyl-peptidase [Phenylobacterium zucineum HLK1]
MRVLSVRRPLAAAAAAGCLLLSAAGHARPVTIEDALQSGTIANTAIDPTERWAVIEYARPYASAPRFDFDLLQPMMTTELRVADLERPGPAALLFPPEPGAGYAAGPFSPDGRRIAVYRLTDAAFSLGVVDLAARTVRWFDVAPDISWEGRAVGWASPRRLLVITPPPGSLPHYVRMQRAWRSLPPRWESVALGGAAPAVWRGGRALKDQPRTQPGRLLRLDVETGAAEVLATGRFVDLEVSASGKYAAVLERGEDVRLQADAPVHGDMGVATFRKRLRLVPVSGGAAASPCPGCDLLQGLLVWAPNQDRLLAYARDDGQAWRQGRLIDVDARTGRLARLPAGFRPAVVGRPEIVAAGWMGASPVVYGRTDGATRDDWWRLAGPRPVNLTGSLPQAPMAGVSLAGERLTVATPAGGWSLDVDGQARRLEPRGVAPLAPWSRGLRRRAGHELGRRALPVRVREAAGDRLHDLAAARAVDLPLPDGAELFAYAPRRGAALVRTLSPGGRQALLWITADRPPVSVLAANPRLSDVEPPRAIPVHHTAPDGRPLTSWLLAPKAASGAPAPPLIVVPYLGQIHSRRPQVRIEGTVRDQWEALHLTGQGYAVLLPSLPLPADGRGPGEGLADRVLAIVDAAARQPDTGSLFDDAQLGLLGVSFGAHNVLAIITQTDRFKVAVAAHGPSSLITKWGEFGLGRVFPEAEIPSAWSIGWAETLQGLMGAPPWEAPDRYVANSPLMHAGRIRTPLLMVQGEFDSMSAAEGERMFSALFRQDKTVELAIYGGEGHVFASPGTIRDYYGRVFAWLDTWLQADHRRTQASSAAALSRPIPSPRQISLSGWSAASMAARSSTPSAASRPSSR